MNETKEMKRGFNIVKASEDLITVSLPDGNSFQIRPESDNRISLMCSSSYGDLVTIAATSGNWFSIGTGQV